MITANSFTKIFQHDDSAWKIPPAPGTNQTAGFAWIPTAYAMKSNNNKRIQNILIRDEAILFVLLISSCFWDKQLYPLALSEKQLIGANIYFVRS